MAGVATGAHWWAGILIGFTGCDVRALLGEAVTATIAKRKLDGLILIGNLFAQVRVSEVLEGQQPGWVLEEGSGGGSTGAGAAVGVPS